MQSRVDLHFHLLPGVDDGPASLDESVALAYAAVVEGTGTIVATPHVRSDFVTDVRELPDRVREVRDRLAAEDLPVGVVCGAELGVDMVGRLSQSELEVIAVGPPGARWLLLESPFGGFQPETHEAADELRDRGFGVVLAHPERSVAADAPPGGEQHLGLPLEIARGSALQVNALSLAGVHGAHVEAAAVSLLREGLVDALASDAHSSIRAPALERGLRAALARGIPEAAARRPTDSGPQRLLFRGVSPRPMPLAA